MFGLLVMVVCSVSMLKLWMFSVFDVFSGVSVLVRVVLKVMFVFWVSVESCGLL